MEDIKIEDKEIIALARRLSGMKSIIGELSYQYAIVEKDFWKTINCKYPNTKDNRKLSFDHQTDTLVEKKDC